LASLFKNTHGFSMELSCSKDRGTMLLTEKVLINFECTHFKLSGFWNKEVQL
jgi:hypothetical protein